jgi:glutamate/tyrosine decarboxylase-like PLP-dependent enzyme
MFSAAAPRLSKAVPPLPPLPGFDWEQFRRDGHRVIDYIADYHIALGKRDAALPVTTDVKPGFLSKNSELAKELAGAPEGQPRKSIDDLLATVDKHVMPGMVQWQHPNFYAFFPALLSPQALLGGLLADSMNQPGFTWSASPSATELEMVVMDWLVDAMQLPAKFKWKNDIGCSVIQSTATEALTVVMLAARSRAVTQSAGKFPCTQQHESLLGRLVCYYSDQSHFCVEKSAKILGIQHRRRITTVFLPGVENYPLDVDDLEQKIQEDIACGLIPFFVSGNFGATGTCAVDPLQEMAAVAQRYGAWMHVDAAYAGATAICPELRGALGNLEQVDSIGINGSKWMSMSMNTSFSFVAHRKDVVASLNATGVYLEQNSATAVVDFKDYHLGLGRPFRSLKVFHVIQSLGLEGIRATIRRHVMLAEYFDGLVRSDARFEVVTKSVFGLVVFRLTNTSSETTIKLVAAVNATKEAYVISHHAFGAACIRVAFAHHATTYEDADRLFDLFATQANLLLEVR